MPGHRADCLKLPKARYITIGQFHNVGWCFYDKWTTKIVNQKVEQTYWECKDQDNKNITELWNNMWTLSIVQQYQYSEAIPWCIRWSDVTEGMTVPWWNCSRVITCQTDIKEIPLSSVKVAVITGCICRKQLDSQAAFKIGIEKDKTDCKGVIGSMEHLVWALSDGTWTTHLPMRGPIREITLGLPTLCPIWKRSPLKNRQELLQVRHKREINEDDVWHEPSSSVKFSWALESFFAPIAAYRNREMIDKLIGQMDRLARITKKGFWDLNIQLQTTTKMTLQNRMALNIMLLKENGVCGYLKDRIDHCCINIPEVTSEVEKDISELTQTQVELQKERQDAEQSWIEALLNKFDLNLGGWEHPLLESVVVLAIVIVLLCLLYVGIKRKHSQTIARNNRIFSTLSRNYANPIFDNPPAYEEARLELSHLKGITNQ
nr:uncharacterized protein LOC110363534 [Columba livia]